MRAALSIAACALGALFAPAVAAASTVSVASSQLTYTASPTEQNQVVITETSTHYVVAEQPGVTISVGAGCTSIAANHAQCLKGSINRISISVLDGTNSADTSALALPTTFSGGSGNDTFTGGSGSDTFSAGGGVNTLNGGGGNETFNSATGSDNMNGGAGDDVFLQGSSADGADVMTGGSGNDTADYSSRSAVLTIDIDDDNDDGAAGELDNVKEDIETVKGGPGATRLPVRLAPTR